MADQNQPEAPAAAVPEPAVEVVFSHHVGLEQYVEGLESELRTATAKDHKAAVLAELDHVRGARAIRAGAPEQA